MVVKQIKKQALKKNENPVSAVCPDISLRKIVENRPELKQIITAWQNCRSILNNNFFVLIFRWFAGIHCVIVGLH